MDIEKPNVTNYSDEECWSRLKDGCKESLAALYFRFYDKLFDYAVSFCGDREIAEDHIQSLFLKVWERRNSLPQVEYVQTYLWTSLRRSLIDTRRKQFKIGESANYLIRNDFNMVSSPEEVRLLDEHNEEVLHKLYRSLERLHPRQKEILYLKFFEGMSYREIEKITSLSYQSIRNYTYEAVKTLRYVLRNSSGHQVEFGKLAILKALTIIFSLPSIQGF